jgi:predicted YcjX-like family ATPase
MTQELSSVDKRTAIVRAMDLDSLATAYQDASLQLADIKDFLEHVNSEMIRRAEEKKATVLFTADAEIEITRSTKIQHRFDVLRTLEGMPKEPVGNPKVTVKPRNIPQNVTGSVAA